VDFLVLEGEDFSMERRIVVYDMGGVSLVYYSVR